MTTAPGQSNSTIPPTVTVIPSSGGLTGGAIGAIVAGIVGGFLILSGVIFFVFHRKSSSGPPPEIEEWREQQDSSNFTYVVMYAPQVPSVKYPEELNETGGRVAGG